MPTIVATRVRAPTQSVRLVFHIGVIERATACSTLFWILDDQAPVVVIDGFHNHEVILVEPGHERGNFRVSELSALRVSNIVRAEDDTGPQTMRHSKTDEEGQGAVLFLGAPRSHPRSRATTQKTVAVTEDHF